MIANDRKYWIALKSIDGVGSLGFKNLVDAFGHPKKVFNASLQSLTAVPRIGPKTAGNVKDFNGWQKAEEELELLKKYYARLITYQDSLYPRCLLNIYDFPPFLYAKGHLKEDDVNIAVVGSRTASTYGKFSTERLCRELAIKGITVVSGLAKGIDSAAHKGALAGKGRTIAVLGCGLDTIYPPENRELYEEIVAKGAVITEYAFGTPPSGSNFPARNRIISGISLGVVVVEANEKSGSLITAKLALEQGREVFAVPGSIDSAGSRGTHRLIKQGAKLIENVYDILEEILPQLEMSSQDAPLEKSILKQDEAEEKRPQRKAAAHELTDAEQSILKSISSKALDIDSIITATGLKPNEALNILLTLELRGIIKQLPGKKFIVKE
jgi:DNA processing protein